jgi:hypothetical protein
LNNAEIVAIGHWVRPMRQKSRIQHRVSTIAGESAPLENLKTPLFGLALATFRRKNAIFGLLRGEQKMNKAAVVGGLGFSTRGRKRGTASALG